MASKIDLEQLRIEIRGMRRYHRLYKVLKEELVARGYWKLHSRGDPMKAYLSRGKGDWFEKDL